MQGGDSSPVSALRRAPLVVVIASAITPSPSLPLGEKEKNCQQQWTAGLRSPRGIAAVAYAKNMPPACFLNAAGWRGAAVTDEGKGIGPQIIHSEATFSQKLKLVFDFPSELAWSFWVAFPSSAPVCALGHLPPRGRLSCGVIAEAITTTRGAR